MNRNNVRSAALFIATSLDGFIARPDGDISFLDSMAVPGEDYGYQQFIDSVDTVVVGRNTWEKVQSMGISMPYPGKQVYVVTQTLTNIPEGAQIWRGNPVKLIQNLKLKPGAKIYVDGGAQVIKSLLIGHQIDEITLSVVPVMLGEGIRLFAENLHQQNLKLQSAKSFKTGLVQSHYRLDNLS